MRTDARVDSPVAIGGCGSSGTNLLRRMLDAHPEMACGEEMSVFDRPHTYRMDIQELRRMYRNQEFGKMEEELTFPIRRADGDTYFGLRRGNHGETYHRPAEIQALLEEAEDVANFWNLFFTHYARKEGKRRWAEKTPNNIFCARRFLEFYPEGRFIHMLRNGRDVCLSLIDRRNTPPAVALTRWILSIEAARDIRGHERCYEVRYENLVTDPEQTLRDLFAWLGMEYTDEVLDFHEGVDHKWGYADSPVHTKSLGRWERQREDLDEPVRRMLGIGLRSHLERMGYNPSPRPVSSGA